MSTKKSKSDGRNSGSRLGLLMAPAGALRTGSADVCPVRDSNGRGGLARLPAACDLTSLSGPAGGRQGTLKQGSSPPRRRWSQAYVPAPNQGTAGVFAQLRLQPRRGAGAAPRRRLDTPRPGTLSWHGAKPIPAGAQENASIPVVQRLRQATDKPEPCAPSIAIKPVRH
jgi:hypothetical protein